MKRKDKQMKKKFYCGNCHYPRALNIELGYNFIKFRCYRCGMFNEFPYIKSQPKIITHCKVFEKREKELKRLRRKQQKLFNRLLKEFKTG